jgi:hypothetical protein
MTSTGHSTRTITSAYFPSSNLTTKAGGTARSPTSTKTAAIFINRSFNLRAGRQGFGLQLGSQLPMGKFQERFDSRLEPSDKLPLTIDDLEDRSAMLEDVRAKSSLIFQTRSRGPAAIFAQPVNAGGRVALSTIMSTRGHRYPQTRIDTRREMTEANRLALNFRYSAGLARNLLLEEP